MYTWTVFFYVGLICVFASAGADTEIFKSYNYNNNLQDVDITMIKDVMAIIVARIAKQYIEEFSKSQTLTHIRHEHWEESCKKSNVVSVCYIIPYF